MPALTFIITDAGAAAIAAVGALGPVTLSQVAIGSGAWAPTSAAEALHAEIKRIAPEGSSVPAPATVHITAADKSADAYEAHEIGIYTSAGILFAIYSQADPIFTKGAGSAALLAIDLVITGTPPGAVTVGDAEFQYPPASETVIGVAKIATAAQVTAGLDDATIVTPKKLANSGLVKRAGDTMTGALNLYADPVADVEAATKRYVDARDAGRIAIASMIGAILPFPATIAPAGWLLMDGSAKSRAAYPALWAFALASGNLAISEDAKTTNKLYGAFGPGDGATTFTLPEMRGEFIRGLDNGRGVDIGRAIGSSEADDFKAHTHSDLAEWVQGIAHDGSIEGDRGAVAGGVTGSTGGVETRPRNVAFPYFIFSGV